MRLILTVLGLTLLSFSTLAQDAAPPAAPQLTPLSVMTFNLRYASNTKPNAWTDRRPVMASLLREYNPDLVGAQEGLYQQLKDLAADLPHYDWIGLGREGGSRGEFMAVFFKKDRLEPLEFDHYWLSDTPSVMASKSWGNNVIRMVTWVRFRDRATKQEFLFVNTHFDHQSQPSREKSAELVRKRIEALRPELPLILVGDFNAAAKRNPAYDVLTAGNLLADTWETAKKREGEVVGTFHNYRGPVKDGARIDWILTRGKIEAESTQVITFSQDGQYPSDHFPVIAKLKLGQ